MSSASACASSSPPRTLTCGGHGRVDQQPGLRRYAREKPSLTWYTGGRPAPTDTTVAYAFVCTTRSARRRRSDADAHP
jgi:hypothetical protein